MDQFSTVAATIRWVMAIELVTFVPLTLITIYVIFTLTHTHILHLHLRLLLMWQCFASLSFAIGKVRGQLEDPKSSIPNKFR